MKGWRTIAFNIATGIFIYLETQGVTGLVPASWEPHVALLVVAGNIYLRTITSTPVGRKG